MKKKKWKKKHPKWPCQYGFLVQTLGEWLYLDTGSKMHEAAALDGCKRLIFFFRNTKFETYHSEFGRIPGRADRADQARC